MGEERAVYDTVIRAVDSAFLVLNGKMKAVKTATVAGLQVDDSVCTRHALECSSFSYMQMCLRPLRRNPRERPRPRLAIAADHERAGGNACVVYLKMVGYRSLSRDS